MKSTRPILYAVIGFFVGAIAGSLILGLLFPNLDSISSVLLLVFPLGGGALGALALGLFGRKLSRMQEVAEQKGGYFLLLNVLIAAMVIASIVISLVLGFIYGIVQTLAQMAQNSVVVFALTAISNILSAWFAVWYVAHKGYLQPDHKPARVAGITVGVFLGLALIFASLIFVLPQEVARGIMTNVSTGTYVQWAIGLVLIYASLYFFTRKIQSAKLRM